MINIFINYSSSDRLAYHTLVQKIIDDTGGVGVNIIPLKESEFSEKFAKYKLPFLCPFLSNYIGLSLYIDCRSFLVSSFNDILNHNMGNKKVVHVKFEQSSLMSLEFSTEENLGFEAPCSLMLFNNKKCKYLSSKFLKKASYDELYTFDWVEDEYRDTFSNNLNLITFYKHYPWVEDQKIGGKVLAWSKFCLDISSNPNKNPFYYSLFGVTNIVSEEFGFINLFQVLEKKEIYIFIGFEGDSVFDVFCGMKLFSFFAQRNIDIEIKRNAADLLLLLKKPVLKLLNYNKRYLFNLENFVVQDLSLEKLNLLINLLLVDVLCGYFERDYFSSISLSSEKDHFFSLHAIDSSRFHEIRPILVSFLKENNLISLSFQFFDLLSPKNICFEIDGIKELTELEKSKLKNLFIHNYEYLLIIEADLGF